MKSIFYFIFLLILTLGCLDLSGGSNTLIKEASNKSHSKKAVLFLRESGATVPNSYQVSIFDFEKEFDTSAVGNTFTVDSDHGAGFLSPENVNFTWISDDSLRIDYDKRLRTFVMESSVQGVHISYREIENIKNN